MTPFLPVGIVDSGGLAAMSDAQVRVYIILCRYAKAPTLRAWPSVIEFRTSNVRKTPIYGA